MELNEEELCECVSEDECVSVYEECSDESAELSVCVVCDVSDEGAVLESVLLVLSAEDDECDDEDCDV